MPRAYSALVALGAITKSIEQPLLLTAEVTITSPTGARVLRSLLDSGASENFISHLIAVEESLPAERTNVRAHSIGGHNIPVRGRYTCEATATDIRGTTRTVETGFLATEIQGFDAILGAPWLREADPDCHWAEGFWQYRPEIEIREMSTGDLLSEATGASVYIAYMLPTSEEHWDSDSETYVGSTLTEEVQLPPEYEDYREVFSKEGAEALPPEWMTVRHSIEVEPGQAAPWGPIYPLSAKELSQLRDYLATNLELGRIRKSNSPAGAPILFSPKKDGTLRLCVDYRGLNKITRKNRYPLPLINEILDRLSGAKVFTKLDLRDAYYRIRIQEGDEWKTAFRTRYGLFEYVVMPFGLTGAPSTFQAYINEALSDILDVYCIAYMDDIIIYSDSPEQHLRHVREVLERLHRASLYVKLAKCSFSTEEVDFLGYHISVTGVSMDPSRVQTVTEWPRPKSFRDIQVFIGFCNFYRRFIYEFSRIAAPMTSLLKGMEKGKKKGPFEWNDRAEDAFRHLQTCFTKAPLLQHFDPSKPSRLETDASIDGIAAVHSQPAELNSEGAATELHIVGTGSSPQRTIWKPVAFWSRKTTPAERNYSTGDQEMLAVVEAFKEWQHYLIYTDSPVQVVCDHYNLQQFILTKSLNRRQMRWAAELGAYYFTIVWRAGKSNPADGPSRRPDYQEPGDAQGEPTENALHVILDNAIRGASGAPASHMRGLYATIATVPRENDNRCDTVSSNGHADTEREPSYREIPNALATQLLDLQSRDAWCRQVRAKEDTLSGLEPMKGSWGVDSAGLVRIDKAIYVPRDAMLRTAILKTNHDDPWQGGHFGVQRTLEVIQRLFKWEGMRSQVTQFVKSCDVCQRGKTPRHKPYGLLQPLPIPEKPWQSISMDFITGLPPSMRRRTAFDTILVVVCRYSKMAVYIPTVKTIQANDLAELIIENVIAKFGAPESIVSDRDKLFTSGYWASFCYHLVVRRNMSTAFHPQTDGQTERTNQTLECYLRCFTNYAQDDWVQLLPSAEYVHNNHVNESTKSTPFQLVLTFTPTIRMRGADEAQDKPGENPHGKEDAMRFEQARQASLDLRKEAQARTKAAYDKKRIHQSFKEGERVLLSSKFIRKNIPYAKLFDRFIGPFPVQRKVGENAYELKLPPKYGRMHYTFHVSLLERYVRREGEATPEPVDIDGEEQWEVDRITSSKETEDGTLFLVRWKGYPESESTWQTRADLVNAQEKLQEYENRMRRDDNSAQGRPSKRRRR